MKILVANIGSTSFKFRLFEVADGSQLEQARGGVDRIGGAGGKLAFSLAGDERPPRPCACADHAAAIAACLDALKAGGALGEGRTLDAVAFKAVMARDCEPVALVNEDVLAGMEYYASVAPAHNPPYVAAMRSFARALPDTPLVAAFEPGFHRTVPERRWRYAVALDWAEKYGVRRHGFHGASHRYVAQRTAELMDQASRIISCHLGGSSSLCAIRDGESVATSMGFSPQSGLPQGSRVGELDPFAVGLVARETGKGLEQVLAELGSRAGLAAMSGTGGDMRDIESAAEAGDERAVLAVEALATAVRDYLGAYLVELGGAEAAVFTGGIGQHSPLIRKRVCRGLEFAGIRLDGDKNAAAEGECRIDADQSNTAIWVMPTNEELIVARQAAELLQTRKGGG